MKLCLKWHNLSLLYIWKADLRHGMSKFQSYLTEPQGKLKICH